jgi:hypothetical protein
LISSKEVAMGKTENYRTYLKNLPGPEWEAYLMKESGLPGPRGNLELAQVAADEGNLLLFQHFLTFDPRSAPTNHPGEFLAFCGVCGLGRLIAEGQDELLPVLRPFASDPRWRLREATAMALQRVGNANLDELLKICEEWSGGGWLEKRAVIAGLAEPVLLKDHQAGIRILALFDRITEELAGAADRKDENYRVLRQGLAYAWSVVAAAFPKEGIQLMERWLESDDPDVIWVMRENLKKKRLARAAPGWTDAWLAKLTETKS